jgi:hypothetical protein
MAALMLSAGCGGGSSKKGASSPVQVGPHPIVAKEGEFSTVIPRGYANHPSVAQYWAQGPVENGFPGFPTSVIVVRNPVGKEVAISTYAHRLLRAFGRSAGVHARPLSVDGEPGFVLDYIVTGTGSVKGVRTHVRQVLVKHGPWVFFIRDIALPAQYAASLGALDEVLSNWRWR